MTSRNRLARSAALLWILMGLTSASIGLGSVRRWFFVRDDAAATVENILRAETLYRAAIVGELLSQTIFLLLGLTVYALLKEVQRSWARAMLALVVAGAAVGFANCLNQAAPLVLLRGPASADFTPGQLEQLAYGFLRLRGFGATIVTWFLGLWLIPFGMLAARSRMFPRVLGPLLAFAGVAHAVYALVVLAAPAAAPAFFTFVAGPSGAFGELPMLLWLLIKGADSPIVRPPAASAVA